MGATARIFQLRASLAPRPGSLARWRDCEAGEADLDSVIANLELLPFAGERAEKRQDRRPPTRHGKEVLSGGIAEQESVSANKSLACARA